MGYVAIKGGEDAIRNSKKFYYDLLKKGDSLSEESISDGLIYLTDKVVSEGSLYSDILAAKSVKESGGDPLNAAFYLRAHRSTCKRAGECEPISVEDVRILRKISSAFKDIPGGQILGPSGDYILRLLVQDKDLEQVLGDDFDVKESVERYQKSAVDVIRGWGLVKEVENLEDEPFDVTRVNPVPPYSRSAALQIMSRGETGAMLAFAYTSMRGYGDVHPTVGDMRIGYTDVNFTHPLTGKPVKLGEIRVTTCEMVSMTHGEDASKEGLKYSVGFGFCMGFNETKALSMGILDNAMAQTSFSTGGMQIAANPEIVLNHIDGIESFGFCNHYKLPHYVTFQSDLNVVKNTGKGKGGDK